MIIIYKIKDEDNEDSQDSQDEDKYEIKLFGEKFIENNKNNCKIIIDNKDQDLIEYLKINKNEKILKIKLKEIKTITNMSYMLSYCNSLTSLPDISNWNTSNVTNMSYMFYYCSSLKSLPDISKWNTNNVTNMNTMFQECNQLISIPDISKWNTSNVTDISFMFNQCNKLISLPDIKE